MSIKLEKLKFSSLEEVEILNDLRLFLDDIKIDNFDDSLMFKELFKHLLSLKYAILYLKKEEKDCDLFSIHYGKLLLTFDLSLKEYDFPFSTSIKWKFDNNIYIINLYDVIITIKLIDKICYDSTFCYSSDYIINRDGIRQLLVTDLENYLDKHYKSKFEKTKVIVDVIKLLINDNSTDNLKIMKTKFSSLNLFEFNNEEILFKDTDDSIIKIRICDSKFALDRIQHNVYFTYDSGYFTYYLLVNSSKKLPIENKEISLFEKIFGY